MPCPNCGNRDPYKAKPWVEHTTTRIIFIGSECLVCGTTWKHSPTATLREFGPPEDNDDATTTT